MTPLVVPLGGGFQDTHRLVGDSDRQVTDSGAVPGSDIGTNVLFQ